MPSPRAHPADDDRPRENRRRLRILVVTKLPRSAARTTLDAVEDAAALLSLHGHRVIDAGAARPGRRPLWTFLTALLHRLPLFSRLPGRWLPNPPARAEDLLADADVLVVPARADEQAPRLDGSPVVYPVTVGYGHKDDSVVLQLIAEPSLLSSLQRLAEHIERDKSGNRKGGIREDRETRRAHRVSGA
jgi:hypothetical protein